MKLLLRRLGDLESTALEWQAAPGTNTVGMLLAHLAIVETYWIGVTAGITDDREADEAVKRVLSIGIDDDGLPLPSDGGHPPSLAGWDLPAYLGLLHRAREGTHRSLAGWADASLAELCPTADSRTAA